MADCPECIPKHLMNETNPADRAPMLCDLQPPSIPNEPSATMTSAQMKEVDEAFALFDYSEKGFLDLYEVKVMIGELINTYFSVLATAAFGCHGIDNATLDRYGSKITLGLASLCTLRSGRGAWRSVDVVFELCLRCDTYTL